MSVFARGSKYRIKETHNGRFYVEERGWFFWHELGTWAYLYESLWNLTTYKTVAEAEKAIQELCRQATYPRIVKYVKCCGE